MKKSQNSSLGASQTAVYPIFMTYFAAKKDRRNKYKSARSPNLVQSYLIRLTQSRHLDDFLRKMKLTDEAAASAIFPELGDKSRSSDTDCCIFVAKTVDDQKEQFIFPVRAEQRQ